VSQVYLFFLVLFGGLALLAVLGDFLDADVGEVDADPGGGPGADLGTDAWLDVDADAGVAAGEGGAVEARGAEGGGADTQAEKILSIRGLVYSLFGFGLTGALLTGFGAPAAGALTIGVSAAAGLGAGWTVTRLLRWLRGSEAGARPGDESFVGRTGRMRLPMRGGDRTGRVRVHRGERTYDLRALPHPAASGGGDPGSWERVMVLEVREGVALVAPVDEEGLPLEAGGTEA